MSAVLNSFENFSANNGPLIMDTLQKEFSVDSLRRAAKEHGFADMENEVDKKMAKLASNTRMRVSYQDANGKIRELTIDEADLAAGGVTFTFTIAVALAVVAVAVYAAAYSQAAVYGQAWVWG